MYTEKRIFLQNDQLEGNNGCTEGYRSGPLVYCPLNYINSLYFDYTTS